MSLVDLTSDGLIRTITLNAPERLNALDQPLLDELAAAIAAVADDPDARALVITGAGRGFCAGADLEGLFGDRSRPTSVLREVLRAVYGSFLGIRELQIPTIAAVHGPAVGAGLNIALACDVIVAGPRAKFGATFSAIGLHPGGGCTWMLTERIGRAATSAILFAGDPVSAEHALAVGIAQETSDDPQARAQELAALYARRNPSVMRHIKQATRIAASSDFETTLDYESWAQAASLTSEEFTAFSDQFKRN